MMLENMNLLTIAANTLVVGETPTTAAINDNTVPQVF